MEKKQIRDLLFSFDIDASIIKKWFIYTIQVCSQEDIKNTRNILSENWYRLFLFDIYYMDWQQKISSIS